ncbi:MAG: sulfate reduction electron transfer complex DsrMKJOP subunit DsrJ [Acidobacteriia bacterium]|nr:sulfate reduction electron transfer complex DsrMKJOP subunit DsrJ [Terriglobia bacterium]
MRDRGVIVAGLLAFLGLISFPFWYDLGAGKTAKGPELRLPEHEKECVAPVPYMKTSHMKLLNEWRDQVVRNGIRTYTAYNGKTYAISLTGTCLQRCHVGKAEFCDRCHAYNGVRSPYCWDCHVDPQLARQAQIQMNATRTGDQDGRR